MGACVESIQVKHRKRGLAEPGLECAAIENYLVDAGPAADGGLVKADHLGVRDAGNTAGNCLGAEVRTGQVELGSRGDLL